MRPATYRVVPLFLLISSVGDAKKGTQNEVFDLYYYWPTAVQHMN
jgi:hypothetical protein